MCPFKLAFDWNTEELKDAIEFSEDFNNFKKLKSSFQKI